MKNLLHAKCLPCHLLISTGSIAILKIISVFCSSARTLLDGTPFQGNTKFVVCVRVEVFYAPSKIYMHRTSVTWSEIVYCAAKVDSSRVLYSGNWYIVNKAHPFNLLAAELS